MPPSSTSLNETFIDIRTRPAPGQLVEVRRRRWVVDSVRCGALPVEGIDRRQHVVSLLSLEDDALGEELDVVWQVETDAIVLEKTGLPKITGYDSEEWTSAFLNAVRWGTATSTDRSLLQSPFRSGITIEDYQLDPLIRAVEMARVNLLIADDVGLGKTIEAGLVMQELLIRHRARTMLVVCPASLQIKWQTEMLEKFGLEFRIVDTDYIKRLRRDRGIHVNPWSSFPRLITSMDWIKAGEGLRLLRDILPQEITYPRKFDLLVVDEAHNVAPASSAQYAMESQRTKLIRTLSPHFSHRLFLSATPHNGYQESFTSLLELLDDQRFARSVMPDPKQLHRVMIRRLKKDITDASGKPVFPERRLEALEIDYTEEERKIHTLLRQFSRDRRKSMEGTRYAFGTDFVLMLLKKRLFSSPRAFATTLVKHKESLENQSPQRKKEILEERILHKAILKAEEEYANDEEVENAQNDAVELVADVSEKLTPDQKTMLAQLSEWAEKNRNRKDSKVKALLDWLEKHLRPDSQWNDKRVILFTEYRATHSWLFEILTGEGFGKECLMILHGGMDTEEREQVKAAFQADPKDAPVRILLATDAASEGIDLQNHCNYLIHIEIPWNPNVMEQRNGRIDRHGQIKPEVFIWHPVGKGFNLRQSTNTVRLGEIEGDHEYLMRAALKVDTIREDLGSVGTVIAKQIEEAMLGLRSELDTSMAERRASSAKRTLASEERRFRERITQLHDRLLSARKETRLTPEHVRQTVEVGLQIAGQEPLIPVSHNGIPDGKLFELPPFSGATWGKVMEGLEHPHTKVIRPITFDHDIVRNRDDIVLAHLNHRLVQKCLRLLREELWSLDDAKKLHRISVRSVPDSDLSELAVAVWSRLVIIGGNYHRIHEELTLSGGELKHRGFSRLDRITQLTELVENGKHFPPSDQLFAVLKKRFEANRESIINAVEARSRDRLQNLDNTVARFKKAEIEDLNEILNDLEKAIRKRIDEYRTDISEQSRQLFFEEFSDEERLQYRKDMEALENRLKRIPLERINETVSIENRYDNLVPRTFPVAVVFLVPERLVRHA